MNTSHKRLAIIGSAIIALLVIYFYPSYGIHLLAAVTAAILVEYANRRSRVYRSLKWLQITKEKFHRYAMRKKLDKILKEENREEYRKKLIENALEKAKSIDESERETGLKQLCLFGTEDTYEKLLGILKNTRLTKSHEMQIIETLNKLKNVNKR